MTIWCLFVFLLIEWKLGYVRFLWRAIRHTAERCTAPTISVEAPPIQFDAPPAAEALTPMSAGEGLIQCYDKGTNVPLGTVKAFSPDEVRAAVEKARVAQKSWAASSFATRRKLLFSLMDYILAHQRLICTTACIECGKTMMDGTLGEMLTTFEKLRWTIERGEEVLAEEVRDVGLMTIHKRAAVNYLPFGVIGAIVSWNYPFHNIFGPMISALFAGNAFVGKVSEYSSYYAGYYQSIVRDGLVKLGYSPDLVCFVTGFAETGAALLPAVDKLTFIGSPQVGKIIMRNASATLTPVVLELGGKDPAIVCEDADLDQLIPIIMRGNFQNCGQNCVGLERILVHESIHDHLVAELKARVEKLTQGASSESECDLGAMTMGRAAIPKIQDLVNRSVAAGATLVCGGTSRDDRFFAPTILTNVVPTTPVAEEEVFGPIMAIFSFRTDAEAIAMVNASEYGLGSSVFSANAERAQHIANAIRTGMVNVNDFGINYLCQSLPFGGVKISGFDRFAGREGLRGNCIVRASTTDRFPGVSTQIPEMLRYPISTNAFAFMENLSHVIYGRWTSFIPAVKQIISLKPVHKKKQ